MMNSETKCKDPAFCTYICQTIVCMTEGIHRDASTEIKILPPVAIVDIHPLSIKKYDGWSIVYRKQEFLILR